MPSDSPSSEAAALALVREGWNRLRRQSPLAAWAAWQEALRIDPDQPAAREALDRLAAATDLPPAARRVYRLRSPEPDARPAWDALLRAADGADAERARQCFARLAAERPDDAAAHYNLGLCSAWTDRNAEAVAALLRAAQLDSAAGRGEHAAEAVTLAEVLRHGSGAEHLADDVRCALVLDWPDALGDPIARLAPLGPYRLPLDTPHDVTADLGRRVEWLDRPFPEPGRPELDPAELPSVRATSIEQPGVIVFHALDPAVLVDLERQIHYLLGRDFRPRDRRTEPLPINLLDSAAWQFRLPDGLDPAQRIDLTRRAFEHHYLHRWVDRPRLGLGPLPGQSSAAALSPRQAARNALIGTDPSARHRLEGIIRLREELANRPAFREALGPLDLDSLRRLLGLEHASVADPQGRSLPVDRLDPDALEALDPDALTASDLITGFRTAIRPSTVARLLDALERRFPDQLTGPALRATARLALQQTLEADGPEAALRRIERWRAAARDDSAHAFLDQLQAELALEGFGDEDAAIAWLNAAAARPSIDPDTLIRTADLLRELGAHETAHQALQRGLHTADRAGNLAAAARLWDALGRPPRDPSP
ncbi:MAG: hypothetical protein KatS3mg108_2857 [Isosphaeraceae bacterium]|jgi:tetratricopeptide (TPR) repeat protein|nr:MAG: hypothetical protein KatS3mg108_2857 [Isosphaeraceae bacterium]